MHRPFAVLAAASTLDAMTLPQWPTEINRTSIETLAKLGQADGVFEKAPELSQLLP